jgi:hypothetical protein
MLKRILNVLIAEALRDKLFTTGSVKRVLNWSITPLFSTIVLLIVNCAYDMIVYGCIAQVISSLISLWRIHGQLPSLGAIYDFNFMMI